VVVRQRVAVLDERRERLLQGHRRILREREEQILEHTAGADAVLVVGDLATMTSSSSSHSVDVAGMCASGCAFAMALI
jgi:hypothetical protein